MRSATPRSILAALCALLLLASACSSSSTETDDASAEPTDEVADTDAAADDSAAPDGDAPADPALVEQYGFSLTGTPLSLIHI